MPSRSPVKAIADSGLTSEMYLQNAAGLTAMEGNEKTALEC